MFRFATTATNRAIWKKIVTNSVMISPLVELVLVEVVVAVLAGMAAAEVLVGVSWMPSVKVVRM
jgi:hypothetical protein